MTRPQAIELIERLPYLTTFAAPNARLRLPLLRQAAAQDDPVQWVRVIKTCYVCSDERLGGRGFLSDEERACQREAQQKLFALLAQALQLPESDVDSYIRQHLSENA